MNENALGKPNYKMMFVRISFMIILLGLLSWFAAIQYASAQTIIYVIPSGTSQRLAAGAETVNFPTELVFTVGDSLVIENQDDVVHAFGPFTILPHTTLTKRFETVRIYQNVCTFHQDKSMIITVEPGSWDILR